MKSVAIGLVLLASVSHARRNDCLDTLNDVVDSLNQCNASLTECSNRVPATVPATTTTVTTSSTTSTTAPGSDRGAIVADLPAPGRLAICRNTPNGIRCQGSTYYKLTPTGNGLIVRYSLCRLTTIGERCSKHRFLNQAPNVQP
jgi:hypothetical protein